MPERNPLQGIAPKAGHSANEGEAAISQYVEKIEGEVALDAYVRAQVSAPEVAKRITELENCLQRLANAVRLLSVNSDCSALRRICVQSPRKQYSSSRIGWRSITPSIDSIPNWEFFRTICEFLRKNNARFGNTSRIAHPLRLVRGRLSIRLTHKERNGRHSVGKLPTCVTMT